MGEQVLPSGLSITENPLRKRLLSSRAFDGEGLATRQSDVVTDGVLQRWSLDLGTARQLGLTSTASASRGVSSPPSPSITSIELTQGPKSRAELLADMGTGLLITSMIGSTINATTGDYSRGAAGLLGGKRRDHLPGQRMHRGRQPARHGCSPSLPPTTPAPTSAALSPACWSRG